MSMRFVELMHGALQAGGFRDDCQSRSGGRTESAQKRMRLSSRPERVGLITWESTLELGVHNARTFKDHMLAE